MTEKTTIRITTFKQLKLNQKKKQLNTNKDDCILNLIIYSPNAKLKFLDPHLKQWQQKSQVLIAKCNNMKNLQFALKSNNKGVQTLIISDKELDQQMANNLAKNEQILNQKYNIKICLYVSVVQLIASSLFHNNLIRMVTVDDNKIVQYLKSQINKILSDIEKHSSTSTIMEKDYQSVKRKMNEYPNSAPLILGNYQSSSENEAKYFDNGVPGVGTYNISKDILQK